MRTVAKSAVGVSASLLRVERWTTRDHWLAVLFHHVTDGDRHRADDPRIVGLGADVSDAVFRAVVHDLARRYAVVDLDEVVRGTSPRRRGLPRLVICFDDAYASVFEVASPILHRAGLPWAFFVNPHVLDGRRMALDNLLAYVTNLHGLTPLERAFGQPVHSLRHAVAHLLPTLDPPRRALLVEDLAQRTGVDVAELANAPRLHVSAAEVRQLAENGVRIGNHTYDHVHGRSLDAVTAIEQIVGSQERLAQIVGRTVDTFAYPYGSPVDATPVTTSALVTSGHTSAFLADGRTNSSRSSPMHLSRVSITAASAADASLQLRVLPRLRDLKQRVSTLSGASA